MGLTRSSLLVVLTAPAIMCGCFALFSLDDYGPGAGPDGGPDAPNDDAAAPEDGGKRPRRVVFVTSDRFAGAMEGIAGADKRCSAAAAAAGLPGTYVAWLSAGGTTAAARLAQPERDLVLPNDAAVAAGLAELAATGPRVRLVVTEKKDTLDAAACGDDHVWTNTRADGTLPDAAIDCMSWTSNASGGGAGQLGGAHDEWTDGCLARACDARGHLYCFEK